MADSRLKKVAFEEGEIDVQGYRDARDAAQEIVDQLNQVNRSIRQLTSKLSVIGETRCSEYLRSYGPGYIDKVIETLENDTIRTLEQEL